MIKSYRVVFFVLTAGFLYNPADAYAQRSDLQWWGRIGVEKELARRLDVYMEYQSRTENNSRQLEQQFGEVAISYIPLRFLKTAVAYRYLDQIENYAHRFQMDNTLFVGGDKAEFGLRVRYQYRTERGNEDLAKLRFRLQYEQEVTKFLRLEASVEQFYTTVFFNTQNEKQRYSLDSRWELAKDHFLYVFYRVEIENSLEIPARFYILGTGYKFRF